MPISQDRMAQLVSAGQDALGALQRAMEIIEHECSLAREGTTSWEQACQNIELLVGLHLMGDPLGSQLVLQKEAEHYKRTRKRNEASARWARKRRQSPAKPAEEEG